MVQDGIWVAPTDELPSRWAASPNSLRYDYELIARLEVLIADAESGWRHLYGELGLAPTKLSTRT